MNGVVEPVPPAASTGADGPGARPAGDPAPLARVEMPTGYRRSRIVARFLGRVVFSWRVQGCEHIPERGGFIIAANHAAYVDPPLIGAAATRCLRFMAKEELFDVPVLRWVITNLGAMPVRRGAVDRRLLGVASDFLRAGGGVLIFPAGTRHSRRGRPGASLLAAECQVPVVPARIDGSDRLRAAFLRRQRLDVRFGKPIAPPPGRSGPDHREVVREHTELIMQAIRGLTGRVPAEGPE